MKASKLFLIIAFLFFILSCSQANQQKSDLSKDHSNYKASVSWHVGTISKEQLFTNYKKFEVSNVEFNQEDIALLKSNDNAIDIWLVFGTWCHDSQREVPRIIKLIEQLGVNYKLHLYAVAPDKKIMDTIPVSSIKYTPTLVLFSGDTELARIIETPQQSWESDLAALLR